MTSTKNFPLPGKLQTRKYSKSPEIVRLDDKVKFTEEEILHAEKTILEFDTTASLVQKSEPSTSVITFTSAEKFKLLPFQAALLKLSPNLHSKLKVRDDVCLYLNITKENGLPKSQPDSVICLSWDGTDKEYFIFEDGAVVGWGVTETDCHSLEQMLTYFSEKSHSPINEVMKFKVGDQLGIESETNTMVVTVGNMWEVKLLYSVALSRSIKLEKTELLMDEAIHRARTYKSIMTPHNINSDMSLEESNKLYMKFKSNRTQQIELFRHEIAKLYRLRYNLIELSEYLSTTSSKIPEEFSSYFKFIEDYLGFENRNTALQRKLNAFIQNWESEHEHAFKEEGWRLDNIIIFLLLLEVLFHVIEKSEWFQKWTWETSFRWLFGIPQPKKKNKFPFGDDYEIVEEVYETID